MMNKLKRSMFVAATSAVLLIAGTVLYAEAYLAPATSTGTETIGQSVMNVGQGIIGQADDGSNVFAHMGVIPIFVASIPPALGDCTGNHVVNIGDYEVFQACIDGPDGILGAGCECADLDGDTDVDLQDAAIHVMQY